MLYKIAGITVFPYLYFLLFGMMAWYHRQSVIAKLENHRYFLLAAYVIWKLCEMIFLFPKILDGVLYNTVSTMLTGCVVFAFSFRHTFHMKQDLTYGFYLYHMVFINMAVSFGYDSFLSPIQGICIFTVILTMTIISAFLSRKLIEEPLNKRWKRI